MSENNQLINVNQFNTKNLIFSDPMMGSIPNSVPPISYKRINLSTKNPDGTIGDVLMITNRCFSFGLSTNTNVETGKDNGYVMPICLWDKNNPSESDKKWSDTFTAITEECKQHLIKNKDEIEQYDLNIHMLNKFNPLYWKREKGKIVEGTGPTLYVKLIESKKQNSIVSLFEDEDGNSIDPLFLKGKYCFVTAIIKIESIFVGNKISLQVKLYQCRAKPVEMGIRSLLPKKSERPMTLVSNPSKPLDDDDSDNDSDGSIEDAVTTNTVLSSSQQLHTSSSVSQQQDKLSDVKKVVVKKVVAKK